MKTKWIFSLLIPALLVFSTPLLGQSDPFDVIDTLIVQDAYAPRGAAVQVEIYLNNDEYLYGVSIPLRFSTQYLSCDTVIFSDTKMADIGMNKFSIDNENGTVLFGTLVMSGEEPISTGPGVLATIEFTVSSEAPIGLETVIDSGFIEPAGEFILTGPEAQDIIPVFKSGIITVDNDNYPPSFSELTKQYVVEGETLTFQVEAFDREKDAYQITASRLPDEAEFNSESGTFEWTPPYVGSGSATGNPHEIVFSASDGYSSTHMTVEVEVINKNRPPQLTLTDSINANAGDLLETVVAAEDPDYEDVSISIENLPDGASFDNQNPGVISWASNFSDSGSYLITVTASDPGGEVSSRDMKLVLNSVTACDLEISEVQGYLGSTGIVTVSLANRTEIQSMQLLIKYDPTAIQLLSRSVTDTRIEDWEYYIITNDAYNGRIWVTAKADIAGGGTVEPLETGEGAILNLSFLASSNTDFAGIYVPIEFEFLDELEGDDNTFVDGEGNVIGPDNISYTDGAYFIKIYDGLVGDINLNGVAFEIADLTYFVNYFIDSDTYPLQGERLQNSDINQDGYTGTVGDLVYLIRIITGDAEPLGKVRETADNLSASLKIRSDENKLEIYCESGQTFGAALLTFFCAGQSPEILTTDRTAGMNIISSYKDDILNILVYDPHGNIIESGESAILELVGENAQDMVLQSVSLADIYGNDLAVKITSAAIIPENFELGQNYPNPFNPTTTISFGIPSECNVNLNIYNIRGQLVKILSDEVISAGYHELLWDGTDQAGNPVSSGVYFYRLKTDSFTESKKMIMLK